MTLVPALVLECRHLLALRDIDMPQVVGLGMVHSASDTFGLSENVSMAKGAMVEPFAFADSIAPFDRAVEGRPDDVKLQIRLA